MEKNIFLIGMRQINSKKNNKTYYIIDYVDWNNIPQTEFIGIETWNKIAPKIKPYTKGIGIFDINQFNKLVLIDVK